MASDPKNASNQRKPAKRRDRPVAGNVSFQPASIIAFIPLPIIPLPASTLRLRVFVVLASYLPPSPNAHNFPADLMYNVLSAIAGDAKV
jgi:hypothetical protein